MNQTLKISISAVVILLVIIGVYSFSNKNTPKTNTQQTQQESTPEQKTIKIGFIGPLTGDAAAYGTPAQQITQLAVDEINAAGGIKGSMLEVIYEDGKCNGKDAVTAAQKLINTDNVKAILGGFCSSESLAIVPVAEASGVFLLSPGSSSPDLTNISNNFARTYPSDATQGNVLATIAYNDKQWKKVAFVQEQQDYPLGIYRAFTQVFESFGGVTVKEEFAPETSDFRSLLTKLRAEKPDALFVDTQTPGAGELVLKQIGELGWNIPLLVSDIISGDSAAVERNAKILEGALAAEFGINPNNPLFQRFITNYAQRYGQEPPFQSYAQTEYDAVYLLADAILNVGYDANAIATWVKGIEGWNGSSGSITIGPDGDPNAGHVGKVIRDGKVGIYEPNTMMGEEKTP